MVLRCRPLPRALGIAASLYFLATGTLFLSRGLAVSPTDGALWRGAAGLLIGACAAHFTARYCLARLLLDEVGFRLKSPIGERGVAWKDVVDWRRRPVQGGLAPNILVIHGAARRRLFVPLVFEESQALEVGLQQRGFPRY